MHLLFPGTTPLIPAYYLHIKETMKLRRIAITVKRLFIFYMFFVETTAEHAEEAEDRTEDEESGDDNGEAED